MPNMAIKRLVLTSKELDSLFKLVMSMRTNRCELNFSSNSVNRANSSRVFLRKNVCSSTVYRCLGGGNFNVGNVLMTIFDFSITKFIMSDVEFASSPIKAACLHTN